MTSLRALALVHRRRQAALLRVMNVEFESGWRRYEAAPAGPETEQAWTAVVARLVRKYGTASATLAADYYDQARRTAGHHTPFTVPVAEPPPLEQITASRRWSANQAHKAADRAAAKVLADGGTEAAAQQARDNPALRRQARDREAASAQRLAALPGRRTIESATRHDPSALGWARVTEGPCCSFCAVLIIRGPVYAEQKSAETKDGGDPYHDRCDCTAEAVFRGQKWAPMPEAAEWEALYNEATKGTYGDDTLRVFRSAFDARYRSGDRVSNSSQLGV
ncbi:hypothetical protein ACH427_19075 [Streptomyces sp. NPDC020379]|uniref:VG15 protein n=1 Tax=Streptomyces sp. NPDC020379 TaxID=3365071 RepID=UPI0037B08D11